jgi:uncharacterized repeat protein (TIGR03943 family)
MNRAGQGVILLLVGAAVFRASITDLYLRYVKEGLRPFLIAAGVLLIVAGVMTLWYEFKGVKEHGKEHGHEHRFSTAWLLMVPVLALLMVVPPALGSFAAGRTGTSLPQASDFGPMPAGDPAKISVIEYASRAVFDHGRSLGERRVRMTGFLVPGPSGQVYLTRMILTCCAADARPVKVGLTGDVPTGMKPDTWVDVTGRYTARAGTDSVNHETIPFLDVLGYKLVNVPREQYES